MTYSEICAAVDRMNDKYRVSDPFELCSEMCIILLPKPLGTAPNAIKGFFLEIKRIKTITVNSDLPQIIQKIIVAHEIGHAALHHRSGIHAFHEVAMFDESSDMEREANLFAAEFLLRDDEVFETLNSDTTFFTAAAKLYVPIELLDFKFRIMKWKGYKMIEPPILANSNFLRDMEVPKNVEYN